MKGSKIKKAIVGAVAAAIVLSLGMEGHISSVLDASTASKVKRTVWEIPKEEFKEADLDVVFVLDNSGSMKNNDPNFITKGVVTNFVTGLGENSRLGMVIFDETARLVEPLTSLEDPQVQARFLESLEAINFRGKFTNSPAGIERAIYELKNNGRSEANKNIIFLTDGIVATGNRNQDLEKEKWLKEDLTRESKNAGIRIFGIAFTDNADFRLIQTLAVRTDGEYFRIFEVADLQEVFTKIKGIIAKPPVPPTEVTPLETTQKVPKEQKETLAQESQERPEKATGDNKSLMLILSGIVTLLGLTLLVQVIRKRKPQAARAVGDARRADSASPSEPLMPQAVLIDVGKAISAESLTLPLNKTVLRVGRDSGNDVIIARKTISSFHATIEYKDGYFYLEDLRSTNGTRLNNEKLKNNEPARLKSGDRIDFSIHEFRFLIPDQTPLGETVEVTKMKNVQSE